MTADGIARRDGPRLDAVTADLVARFGRERTGVYSLDRMRSLMARLGSPQETYRVVHVAGTSGKTSTCYAVRELLEGAGVRTGLTISPHIAHLDERAQVGGHPLGTGRFLGQLEALHDELTGWGQTPSFFEFMAAAAFWIFAREGVQVAVVEVGLGGRLDATNVVERADKVCAIASIGLDHTEVLGDTVTEIAREKGGIIGSGNRVLVQQQDPRILDELRSCATDATSFTVITPRGELPAHLGYQRANTALAVAAYETLTPELALPPLTTADYTRAAAATPPGRFEELSVHGRTVLLDTAHNPQKLTALRERVLGTLPRPYTLCVAFSEAPDHKLAGVLDELHAFDPERFIVTEYDPGSTPTGKRPVPAELITTLAQDLGINAVAQPDATLALHEGLRPGTGSLIITGSTFLIAQLRPALLAAADHPALA